MMTQRAFSAPHRGYVAQTIMIIVLITAAILGYHFYSQNSKSKTLDLTTDIERAQQENVEGLEDDPATAPPAAKRAREMENISEMY